MKNKEVGVLLKEKGISSFNQDMEFLFDYIENKPESEFDISFLFRMWERSIDIK